MNWYFSVLKKYATFSGRARRKEYWMFALFNGIFMIVAAVLDKVLGITFDLNGQSIGYGWLYLIYCLAVFLPGLAVVVRRLHDVGKSGWFFFVCLIPLVGGIWLLVLFCKAGQSCENEYGADPKQFAA